MINNIKMISSFFIPRNNIIEYKKDLIDNYIIDIINKNLNVNFDSNYI